MKYSWSKYVTMKRKQIASHEFKEEVFKREFEKAVNSGRHYVTPIKKMKRFRSAFTTEQVNYLEKEFKKYPYIGNSRRRDVSNVLDIPERAVKIWFQNRRMKEKKDVTNKESDADDRNAKNEIANSQLINVSDIPLINDPPSLPIITAMEESLKFENADKNDVLNVNRSEAITTVPIRSTFYKEISLSPDLENVCKEGTTPGSSPTAFTKSPTSDSKKSAEFSIDLLKKYKQESCIEKKSNRNIQLEKNAAESTKERRNVSEVYPKVEYQKPEFVPILPACTVPQDLSSKKSSVPQFQQSLYSKGLPMSTQQMIPGLNVENTDMPLYLKGYYTQPYMPPGNMIWKPLNATPIMSTGVPRVISNNSASMSTLQQQNMPQRNCSCECHLKHYPGPLVLQGSTPSPQVQYVLTAVPIQQSTGTKFV